MSLGAYGMWFNTLVHVFMYGYYAASLARIRVPWKRYLTSLQIVQFTVSFLSLIPYAAIRARTPAGCTGTPGLIVSAVWNGIFLVLFIQFYRNTYTARKPAAKRT